MAAAEFFESTGLVHFLGGDKEGLVAGGYGDSGEVMGFEAEEDFGDLLSAEAQVLVVWQDTVVANYGQLRAWSGVVTGHAYGLAIQAGDKGASSDGVGIIEGFAVSMAHLFF